MNRLLHVPIALIPFLASLAVVDQGVWLAAPARAAPRTVEVVLRDLAFNPRTITVRPGDTLVFRNEDDQLHSVVLLGREDVFEEEFIDPGATVAVRIPETLEPGTYELACTIHVNMRGQMVVSTS